MGKHTSSSSTATVFTQPICWLHKITVQGRQSQQCACLTAKLNYKLWSWNHLTLSSPACIIAAYRVFFRTSRAPRLYGRTSTAAPLQRRGAAPLQRRGSFFRETRSFTDIGTTNRRYYEPNENSAGTLSIPRPLYVIAEGICALGLVSAGSA